ncbi:MAG: HAD hydrolase-like protein [Firmicutes bacterium]|nr:HAD hydrolase-like protein [Bacillota bacterium]
MKKRYQNLIFDADGTLLDTLVGVHKSINYAMEKLDLPLFTPEQVKPFLGPSLMDTVTNTLKFDEEMATKIVATYREFYAKEGYGICELFPGIKELLFELKKRGHTLTIATNKAQPYIEKIMQEKGVFELFDGIFGQELGQFSSDKTPLVKKAVEVAQPAIMVGDRFIDIVAGKNAGIDTIGVLWGSAEDGEFEKYKPTFVVEKPSDILEVVSILGDN